MGILTFAWGTLVPFLVVLTVLVFVHEMGHYLLARWNGVRIETFSVGFGPELFGRYDRHGTRWRFSAIPIGGYVKMFGDADASSMPGEEVRTMTAEERAVSFHHKSLGARAAVIAAGPGANFLFTIVVLAGMFATVGQPYTPPNIGEVKADSAAEAAGVMLGDTFVTIDGQTVKRFEDVIRAVQLNTGTPMNVVIRRDGAEIPLTVTPRVTETVDRFGNHQKHGLLGVAGGGAIAYVQRDPATATVEAVRETWLMGTGILRAVGQMITGARSSDELGGPITILKASGEVAQGGILALLGFMAGLSVNLGLVNLFPIPVLDGGHLLFYAAEGLRGRPLGQRAQEFGFRVGLAIVLTLMVFATWNDLAHLWPFTKV
ncbi:MAG: regulator of sigma protease [Aliidongia sp.]|jgi:regulator of sigma E protease|nr:regulator of sigma protease [Aliidongia sp.]